MGLDPLLVSFLIGLVSGLAGGVTVLFAMLAMRYRGVDYWACGNIITAVGYILFLLRDATPRILSIVASDALIILALYVVLVGTALFVGKELRFRGTRLALGIALFLFIYFTLVADRPDVGTLLVSLASSLVTIQIAYLIFTAANLSLRFAYMFGGILFGLYGAFSIIRSIAFVISSPARDFIVSPQAQTLTFFFQALFLPLWSAAAVAMIVQRLATELAITATIDYLTQTLNRRGGEARIRQEVARAKRTSKPLSVLLLDIDKFKEINDRHGHFSGDAAVRFVASVMKETLRVEDIICRWGGDEFLILQASTSTEAAKMVAERLRAAVAARDCKTDSGNIRCTLSMGVVTYDESVADVDETIASADEAMYKAKERGGNQVVAA